MTYSRTSLILGVGKSTAAQIDAFVARRGRSYAGDRYVNPPAGLGQAIINAARTWPQAVNHDLLTGQVVHETGGWQSEYSRIRNNPSGLGAINADPDQALWFETPEDGLRATVAHLLTYVSGPGPWTAFDPRAAATPPGWMGSVKRLHELEQKWAWSKPEVYNATPENERYGAKIAMLANQLLETANGDPPVTTYPKPPMIDYPSPNRDGYGVPRRVEAIVNHIATATKASNLAWLTNPASKASCNAYIDKQGQIYELVPYESAPWTNGVVNKPDLSNPIIKRWHDTGLNPNPFCYTIEHEGEPEDALTEAQIAANNQVTAWVASKANIPISRTHIIGHYQIDSVNRARCPSFSDAEWQRLIAGARQLLDGDDVDPPSVPTLPPTRPEPNGNSNPWGTDFWVPEPFIDEVARNEWHVTGWAVSEAFIEDSRIVQYFERARLELQPDGRSVTRGLVGFESMVARYPERKP